MIFRGFLVFIPESKSLNLEPDFSKGLLTLSSGNSLCLKILLFEWIWHALEWPYLSLTRFIALRGDL
jgi:hypothetical protein